MQGRASALSDAFLGCKLVHVFKVTIIEIDLRTLRITIVLSDPVFIFVTNMIWSPGVIIKLTAARAYMCVKALGPLVLTGY